MQAQIAAGILHPAPTPKGSPRGHGKQTEPCSRLPSFPSRTLLRATGAVLFHISQAQLVVLHPHPFLISSESLGLSLQPAPRAPRSLHLPVGLLNPYTRPLGPDSSEAVLGRLHTSLLPESMKFLDNLFLTVACERRTLIPKAAFTVRAESVEGDQPPPPEPL